MQRFCAFFAGRAEAIKGKFSQLEITRIPTTKAPASPGMLPGLLLPRGCCFQKIPAPSLRKAEDQGQGQEDSCPISKDGRRTRSGSRSREIPAPNSRGGQMTRGSRCPGPKIPPAVARDRDIVLGGPDLQVGTTLV